MGANKIPDDLWRKILQEGTKSSKLTYKDICNISISCKRLCRLSNEDSLWILLCSSDFPQQLSRPLSLSVQFKTIYKYTFMYKRSIRRRRLKRAYPPVLFSTEKRARPMKEAQASFWVRRKNKHIKYKKARQEDLC